MEKISPLCSPNIEISNDQDCWEVGVVQHRLDEVLVAVVRAGKWSALLVAARCLKVSCLSFCHLFSPS